MNIATAQYHILYKPWWLPLCQHSTSGSPPLHTPQEDTMSTVTRAPHTPRLGGQAAVSAAKEKQTRHELEMARANNRREIEVRRS